MYLSFGVDVTCTSGMWLLQVHDDANHKIVVNEDGFHSLIIYVTQRYDSGLYTCIARNRGGEDRFQVTLNVTGQHAT